jgi:hypothetical protein
VQRRVASVADPRLAVRIRLEGNERTLGSEALWSLRLRDEVALGVVLGRERLELNRLSSSLLGNLLALGRRHWGRVGGAGVDRSAVFGVRLETDGVSVGEALALWADEGVAGSEDLDGCGMKE